MLRTTILFFLYTAVCHSQNTRYYVDWQSSGLNNGQSWSDAYRNLHDALSASDSGDEIWVARGTYFPAENGDRSARFQLPSGVRLYGGFSGNEFFPEERDPQANPTILSGDIGVPGDSTDNSYNLLYLAYPDTGTLIEGLIFRNAVADNFNVNFGEAGNSGAAMYIMAKDGTGYPTIRHCVFERNTAAGPGGAVYANGSGSGSVAPVFDRCEFIGNRSTNSSGGGIYRSGGSWLDRPDDIRECRFEGNYAFFSGGSVYFRDSERTDTFDVRDCVFYNNLARIQSDGICFGNSRDISTTCLKITRCQFRQSKGTGCLHQDQFDYSGNTKISVDSCLFDSISTYLSANLHCLFIGLADGGTNELIVSNSTISYCSVAEISTYGYDLTFTNVILEHNFKHKTILINGGSVNWENVVFRNNVRTRDLLHIRDSNKPNRVNNLLMLNNYITPSFYLDNTPDFIITNSSFIGNTASYQDYTGLDPSYKFPVVYNCIFQKNKYSSGNIAASLLNPEVVLFPASTVPVPIHYHHCLTDGNTLNAIYDSTTLRNTVAEFVDIMSGNYALSPCSPGVDAGSNDIVDMLNLTTDITGSPRIQGGRVDMGAYERPALDFVQTPLVQPACSGSPGGHIHVTVAHGCEPYTYSWEPSAGNGPELTDVPAGDYRLTVTDQRGRSISDTISINDVPSPVLSAVYSDVVCGSLLGGVAAATTTGGAPPYHYSWNNGYSDSLLTHLTPGSYAVTVTDANGCVAMDSLEIRRSGQLVLQVSGTPVVCSGDQNGLLSARALNGRSPFDWLWSPLGQTDSLIQNLGPGTYTVTVSDTYGCSSEFTFYLEDPSILVPHILSQPCSNLNAPNGTAYTYADGGIQPHKYLWSNGGTTQQITGLSAGIYEVTITDAHGCTVTDSVEIKLLSALDDPEQAVTVRLWPNPADAFLWVEAAEKGELKLYNAQGRMVIQQTCAAGKNRVDVSSFSAGMYWWQWGLYGGLIAIVR